jgi:TM2 domain-containing membrane protein YozV
MRSRTVIGIVLSLVLPGAGHFYVGRKKQAVAFLVIVITLFICGLLVDGKVYEFERGKTLNNLATIGSMGLGVPYLVALLAGPFGDVQSDTFEYGCAFTLTAGLMNLLLMLDVFDVAENRKPWRS